MRIFNFLTLATLILSSTITHGGVNLKNGNFYMTYVDIVVPGAGEELKIQRTYNSKSGFQGWFGFGWGTKYETYLTPGADGSVVVYEHGGGANTRFVPKNSVDPEMAAKKIVEQMRKTSKIDAKAAQDLVQRLTENADLRQSYSRRYNVEAKIADGTMLYSNNRGLQTVQKVAEGYTRFLGDGVEERFNNEGKMLSIVHKDKYTITFNYKTTGTLESIKDTSGKQIFFEFYGDGKVKSLWSSADHKAEYKYKGTDLVEAKDVGGNVYVYDYDKNHNMLSIVYADKSKMVMTYDPRSHMLTTILAKDGEKTEYKYDSNPKNPNYQYWTTVEKTGTNGKMISKDRFEYEIKSKKDGELYTYRVQTEVNGLKTETIYSECCSQPLKITKGTHVTNFEYNDKGLLTKKTSTSGEYVEIQYDPLFFKIAKVVNKEGTTEFRYDKNGNLEFAQNSSGQKVKLIYDLKGRIKTMVNRVPASKDDEVLSFKYNSLDKPIEIQMVGAGQINVSYDNYGKITKVDSKEGNKMALKVTEAFQSLLTIVKPAGVSLSF